MWSWHLGLLGSEKGLQKMKELEAKDKLRAEVPPKDESLQVYMMVVQIVILVRGYYWSSMSINHRNTTHFIHA